MKRLMHGLQFALVAVASATATASTLAVDTLRADEIRVRTIATVASFAASDILYYPFEADAGATVPDASGHGHDGVATQCAWTNEGRYAGGAMAWEANASDGKIVVAGAPDFVAWEAYTLSVWFKHGGIGHGDNMVLHVPIGLGLDYEGVGLCVWPAGVYYWVYDYRDGIDYLDVHNGALPGRNYLDNQWHHAAVVRDGADYRLWVDGAIDATAHHLHSPAAAGSPLYVGNYGYSNYLGHAHNWHGLLDEFRLYDRALSSNEVARLYLDGALPVPMPESGSITATSPLRVTGDMTVEGSSVFQSGIRRALPLGDIPSGIYTNSPPQ